MRRCLQPWWVVGLVTLVYMTIVVASSGGDPLVLAKLGTRFAEGDPSGSEGYDGQFTYYIARDPRTGWEYFEVPTYPYQHMMHILVGRFLAFG
jgi:hypothetical protein